MDKQPGADVDTMQSASPSRWKCTICLDEPAADKSNGDGGNGDERGGCRGTGNGPSGLFCAEGHFTCASCIGFYLKDQVAKLESVDALADVAAVAANGGDIDETDSDEGSMKAPPNLALAAFYAGSVYCPKRNVHDTHASECSALPLNSLDLATALAKLRDNAGDDEEERTSAEEAFEAHVRARTLLPIAKATRAVWVEAQETVQKELQHAEAATAAAAAAALLARQLQAELPNAKMCARCKFGPVMHHGCFDLRAHQVSSTPSRNDASPSRNDVSLIGCRFRLFTQTDLFINLS